MEIELIEPADETATAIALTPEVRAVVALNASKTEFDLRALVEKAKAITQVNSADGREECHGQLMVLVKSRTAITKLAKDVRDDATKFSKAVISEQNRLIAITLPEESRLQTLRDAWDDKVAAEKEARAAAERARVLAITGRIAEIKGYANLAAQCRTSARIQDLIDKLGAVELTGFEEFEQEAKDARAETMKAMEQSFDTKKADEDERARVLAEQQAEAERQRLQAEELARQQAELEAQRAALQAQADAQAAEAKRLQDEREAQAAEAERLAVAAVMLSAVLDEPEPTPEPAAPEPKTVFSEPNPAQALSIPESDAIEIVAAAAPEVSNVVSLRAAPPVRVRPSDADIVYLLADQYRVSELTVVGWLETMDLQAARESLTEELTPA